MFAVIFETHPRHEQWQEYLELAKLLRPELSEVDGFIDNLRYRSLTRDGWILSLSGWRDEKSLVRWRTHAGHHLVQQQGRDEVLLDYHLRVGQITADSHVPEGMAITEQRLDETAMGNGTTIVLTDGIQPESWIANTTPDDIARWLGLDLEARDMMSWDVFQGVLAPDQLILLTSWRDAAAAQSYRSGNDRPDVRTRTVRVIRDYGKYQRIEAPQYYPEAAPN